MDALLEEAKRDDLRVIMDVLVERNAKHGEAIDLKNAQFTFWVGLRNKPAAWTVEPEEFSRLWGEMYPLYAEQSMVEDD